MKLLTMIYDSSIHESIMQLLDGLGIANVTWIYDVAGRGGRGAKMNTPVFPGTNHIALVALPEAELARLRRAVRELQTSYRLKPGIALFSQDVEELP